MGCKRKNLKWAIKEMCKQMGIVLGGAFLVFVPSIVLGILFGDVVFHISLGITTIALFYLGVYTLCDQKSRE